MPVPDFAVPQADPAAVNIIAADTPSVPKKGPYIALSASAVGSYISLADILSSWNNFLSAHEKKHFLQYQQLQGHVPSNQDNHPLTKRVHLTFFASLLIVSPQKQSPLFVIEQS